MYKSLKVTFFGGGLQYMQDVTETSTVLLLFSDSPEQHQIFVVDN